MVSWEVGCMRWTGRLMMLKHYLRLACAESCVRQIYPAISRLQGNIEEF